MIAYVEPKKPATDRLVRVGPDQPIKTLTEYMKVSKPGAEVQFARGIPFDILDGWEPPRNTIIGNYGDATQALPSIRARRDDPNNSSTVLNLKAADIWVAGVGLDRHPASKGKVIGCAIKGDRVTFRDSVIGTGMFRGIVVAENDPCQDVWILNNDIAQVVDYGLFTDGSKGGCKRAYIRENNIRGIVPGRFGNHSTRFYGLQQSLFQKNIVGPSGKPEKSVFNVRGCDDSDVDDNTFTGLPTVGSGAGTGPLISEGKLNFVRNLRVTNNKFFNMNSFNFFSNTEALYLAHNELHFLKLGLECVTYPGWQPPSMTVIGNKSYGRPPFMKGNTSRVTMVVPNELNDVVVVKPGG